MLKKTALAMAVSGTLAITAQSAVAAPAANSGDASLKTVTPIKHLVVIFNENISFDHYFSTYPMVRGTDGKLTYFDGIDSNHPPKVNNLLSYQQGKNGPTWLDFNANNGQKPTLLRDPKEEIRHSTNHHWDGEINAYNAGMVNQFVGQNSKKHNQSADGSSIYSVMGYYDGNVMRPLWNYAAKFGALNDNSFNTQFGPSTPGALNLVAGQTGHTIADNHNVIDRFMTGDAEPLLDDFMYKTADEARIGEQIPHNKAQLNTTQKKVHGSIVLGDNIGNVLNKAGISWGWFQGGFDPGSFDGKFASDWHKSTTEAGQVVGTATSPDYIPHHEPFQYYASTANPHHLPPKTLAEVGHAGQANHQYSLKTFWKSVNNGTLPAVTFLKSSGYQDGHGSYSDPLDEQNWIIETMNKLQMHPKLWKDSLVVLMYDDSDGLFDHVMPPAHAVLPEFKGNVAAELADGKQHYGPRTPLLVFSPYVKRGYVDHTLTDQTSVLRFIEENWQIEHKQWLGASKVAGPLNNMLDFSKPANLSNFWLNKSGEPVYSAEKAYKGS